MVQQLWISALVWPKQLSNQKTVVLTKRIADCPTNHHKTHTDSDHSTIGRSQLASSRVHYQGLPSPDPRWYSRPAHLRSAASTGHRKRLVCLGPMAVTKVNLDIAQALTHPTNRLLQSRLSLWCNHPCCFVCFSTFVGSRVIWYHWYPFSPRLSPDFVWSKVNLCRWILTLSFLHHHHPYHHHQNHPFITIIILVRVKSPEWPVVEILTCHKSTKLHFTKTFTMLVFQN